MVNKGICYRNQAPCQYFKGTITKCIVYTLVFIQFPHAYDVNIKYNLLHNYRYYSQILCLNLHRFFVII